MSEQRVSLEIAIQDLVAKDLKSNECIHDWDVMPNGDVVVKIMDRDLQTATESVAQKLGQSIGGGRSLVFALENGEWHLAGLGVWGARGIECPIRLRRYFETMANEDSNTHWSNGLDICWRWLSLASREITQDEVAELMTRLDDEPSPGPVWKELRSQFGFWARNQRFSIDE